MKKLLLTAASVAATLTFALSGCSSDDKAPGASPEQPASSENSDDPYSLVVKYAECLQKNGLNVKIKPDDGFSLPKDYDPAKKEAAEAACRSVAPPGMYDKLSPDQLDKQVKVAQCLRDKGVDVKDPTEDQPQMQVKKAPSNLRELAEACQKQVDPDSGNGS